ncbi:RNA pyrophosphohydrolase [Gammaproteobacteria bacterium]|jgi:putative (di)nucleoside polyphosphate hydrolase|nr:RNA pyrophosphohydrolase [Gammaproteobacteria bacterium]MDA9997146.1 RNA pyrophosphohydrolase [Gammaproteobacteria bacterium]MDC0367328.1 RNA pyrophosphohydrolase [Gammaproteobacteria bacterium]MDC3248497.1 RNA pyrophosphohydrolase [Gammaproteobacteria bacterium]
MSEESNYRLNVGLIIVNNYGKVLICKRKNSNQWQFPQGGIDKGESPIEAAKREIFEEVGIKSSQIRVLGKIKDWVKYEIPKKLAKKNFKKKGIVGQKQKWFIFKIKSKACISFINDPDNEFDDFAWVSYWHPIALIVSFKKDVYRSVLAELLPIYFNEFLDVS